MADPQSTALDLVGEAFSGLPAPVQKSLFKALGSLLGDLTAVGAAKLKQYARGIEDTTAMRSVVAAKLTEALSKQVVSDPALLRAAGDVYVPTAIRKAANLLAVAERTAEHVCEANESSENAAPPSDDWLNAFIRFAEDASSEKLRDLFARILAGEVLRPGAFRVSTLRAVSELDHETAADFSIVWAKSVGGAVDYADEFRRGDSFARWKRLAEAGLMAPTTTAQYLPPFKLRYEGQAIWSPMQTEGIYLTVYFTEQCSTSWDHIDFTRVGREIGSIIAPPDYAANMREAGMRLAGPGVTRVELVSHGKPTELIHSAPLLQ